MSNEIIEPLSNADPFPDDVERGRGMRRTPKTSLPEGFERGHGMRRASGIICQECGASVTYDFADTHAAWHTQMAERLLPPPTVE